MKKLGTTHENLDHKGYKALKAMILGQKLKPGSKIFQEKFQSLFSVESING